MADKTKASEAGYHAFHNDEGEEYGSFEVFWHSGGDLDTVSEERNEQGDDFAYFAGPDAERGFAEGWYWWAAFPGCLPDSDGPSGPFKTSAAARHDADDWFSEAE